MVIVLENTTTHQTYTYDVVDLNEGKKLFYQFDIDTLGLDDGEYKLTLSDEDGIIETDLVKIGNYNSNSVQYKRGDNIMINTISPTIELEDGTKLGGSTFSSLPKNISTKLPKDSSYLFDNCTNLISLPKLDFSNVENCYRIFSGCTSLESVEGLYNINNINGINSLFTNLNSLKNVGFIDTTNITNMSGLFSYCTSLTSIPKLTYKGNCISLFNSSGLAGDVGNISMPLVTSLKSAFYNCSNLVSVGDCDFSGLDSASNIFERCTTLQKVGNIDLRNATSILSLFRRCTAIEEIGDIRCDNCYGDLTPITNSNITNQITLGGFSGLGKKARNITLNLTYLWGLTEQSVINIANTIEPNTSSYAHQCRIYSTILNSLSDETIALFTNKNWIIKS